MHFCWLLRSLHQAEARRAGRYACLGVLSKPVSMRALDQASLPPPHSGCDRAATGARKPSWIDQRASICARSCSARTSYACYYFACMPMPPCMHAHADECDRSPLTRIHRTGGLCCGRWLAVRIDLFMLADGHPAPISTSGAKPATLMVSERLRQPRWACRVGLDPCVIVALDSV